jgi:DNA-binding transcriptional LysR family regulator
MELRQLEYLVAVVEEASFTRAAARLHVAQPGVSAQIRQLERELGHTLLDRSTRTVQPTEAGAAVLPHARAALDAVANARVAIDELVGLLRGHVSVGTVAARGPVDLPGWLAGFHRDHPGVEITLTEDSSGHLIDNLGAGRLDVALIGLADTAPPGLTVEVVTDRPLVAIAGRGHPLAGCRSISLEDLAAHPLITLPSGSGIRAALDAGFAAARLRPRIAFEAGDPAVLTRLAADGLGVAVLPAAETTAETAAARPAQLREITITDPPMRARLALAWRAAPPAGPAATALVRYITRSIRTRTVPSEAVPSEATPSETVPSETVPSETVPSHEP